MNISLNRKEKNYTSDIILVWKKRTKEEFQHIILPELVDSDCKILVNKNIVMAIKEFMGIKNLSELHEKTCSYVFLDKNSKTFKLKPVDGFYEY